MRFKSWFRGALLAVVTFGALTSIAACSSDDPAAQDDDKQQPPGAKDTIDYVLGPATKQLTDADLGAIEAGADTSQTLRFTAQASTKFERGDVLLAGVSANTPRGLLRLVTNTTVVDGVTVVETVQAPLQLAFEKLHVHVERTLDVPYQLPAPLTPLAGFNVGGTEKLHRFVYNGDDKPETLEDQLLLDDRYQGQLGVTLDFDFDWGFIGKLISMRDTFLECSLAIATLGIVGDCPDLELPRLSVHFNTTAMVSAEFDHAGAASAFYETKPFQLGEKKQLPAITIGPLVFIPEVGFEAETSGRAGSYARLAGHSQAGFQVDIKASTDPSFSASAEAIPPSFTVTEAAAYLDGHVMTSVGPTLDLLAYGAIGPIFGVGFVGELDVDRTRAPDDCYRASLGLQASYGFKVRFPWKALAKFISGDEEIAEDVAWIARKFGLDGDLLKKRMTKKIAGEQVAKGACTTPPPEMLPPGAPQDDTLANPPFVPWARRYDEPGHHFDYSPMPHHARTHLVQGIDGHLWAPSAPSPTLRRIAIDGRQLSAVRYLAPIPDEDRERPLVVTDVITRPDLSTWVLFENGTIARLDADRTLFDAFAFEVPHKDNEQVHLRRGAVREDGRTALVFGINEMSFSSDHRMLLIELDDAGVVLRAREYGPPTEPVNVQHDLLTNGQVHYRQDGTLVLGGDGVRGDDGSRCHVMKVNDDGGIAFARELAPGSGACTFGAVVSTDNGDLVVSGANGDYYGNRGYTIILDGNGEPKTTAGFDFHNDGWVTPLFVARLSTTGYLVAGTESLSAARSGQFVARLDAQGVPLAATCYRTPIDTGVGFLDAYLTKDGGIVFASLAEWNDMAEDRDVTRFLTGKGFAKDGKLTFNAASGMTAVVPEVRGNTLTTFATPLPYSFSDVQVKVVRNKPLRVEPLESPETVFAP